MIVALSQEKILRLLFCPMMLFTSTTYAFRVVPIFRVRTLGQSRRAVEARNRHSNRIVRTATVVSISDAFDGGNIQLDKILQQDDDDAFLVKLKIKPDIYTELEKKNHFQYFAFRATVSDVDTENGVNVTYSIENASESSYSVAWQDSTTCYTSTIEDCDSWKRKTNTRCQDGKLVWSHTHHHSGSVYFAYFPLFTYNQHLALVSQCAAATDATVKSLGQTLDGREMDCIVAGSGERVAWIIHRQHPGESMAEYFAQGLLNRLLGLDCSGQVDGKVRQLLQDYTIYVVPNMCPDGAVQGHLRTNAAGANLNREWCDSPGYPAPTLEKSPEVYWVLEAMKETGVDLFLDVHGDEELPYNFLSGSEETDNWGPRLQALHGAFLAAYHRANPDMQIEFGYSPPAPGTALPNIGTNAIANRFNCLSVTLEMPFKDCWSYPDPERGWSPSRARKLGASALDAMDYIHPFLRSGKDNFWEDLPEEDAYVSPRHNYKSLDA